jgi:hypothetical protein
MKLLFAIALVIASAAGASAQYLGQSTGSHGLNGTGSNPNSHYVAPHITSNGNSVSGHYATNPNNTQTDNFGTRGNVNPDTGSVGTRGARY